jgi:Kef-type K+ transport system membrane component KefB
VALTGFAATLVLGLVLGTLLRAAGLVDSPLLLAVILSATSLGLVIPVLKDAHAADSPLGQLTITASSVADFGAIILLSLLFSREATGTGAKVVLLGGFALLAAVVGVVLARAGRSMNLTATLLRLKDTSAEILVRGAILLMVGFVALAQWLGLEVILAAFIAGAVLKLVDRDTSTHPTFRLKLEAVGYGFLIPVFFISSGIRLDVRALLADASALSTVPIFLVALLIIRGLPALLYRPLIGLRNSVIAGLLQATSLPFIVAATMIGTEIGVLNPRTAAALVAAGLLSVLIFPATALTLLQGATSKTPAAPVNIREEPA